MSAISWGNNWSFCLISQLFSYKANLLNRSLHPPYYGATVLELNSLTHAD